MRNYRPIREFGGWGIRYGGGGRKAYTVRGDCGVEFRLTSGRKVLFGSARPEEFAAAVRTGMQERH